MSKICWLIFILVIALIGCAQPNDQQSLAEIEQIDASIRNEFADAVDPDKITPQQRENILSKYQNLDPNKEVPADLLESAVVYFDANKAKFANQNFLSVIDYKKRSDVARFFVINLKTGVVEKYHTGHGSGSDENDDGYADQFSNIPQSRMSSLGFARTAETYMGRFKRALRLDGLSLTDSALRMRSMVVHGWNNVHEANVIQGLGAGCPALDWKVKDAVIDKIKGGSLLLLGFSNL